jgi:hypothetical protein
MQVEFIASPVSARGHRSVRYPGKDCMPLAPMQPRQAYTANRFCALKRLGQHIVRSPIQASAQSLSPASRHVTIGVGASLSSLKFCWHVDPRTRQSTLTNNDADFPSV